MEYLVNVAVHGVAGMTFGDKSQSAPSPFVRVTVFGETLDTRVVASSPTCSLGNFFSISKRQKPEDFAAEDVTITVLHSGTLGLSTVLGQVVFSLQRVRAKKQHMVETAWFPAVLPENPGEVRGFVSLTIGAYGPGDRVPRSVGVSDMDESVADAEGLRGRAVKLPSAGDAVKSLHELAVRIHQAEALRKVSGTFGEGCHPFVRVDFNGTSQTTQTQSSTSPVWNEEIRVPFMMPSWDDSINVRVFSEGGATSKDALLGELIVHVDDLNFSFTPTWFNFYVPENNQGRGGTWLLRGSKDGDASVFAGRLLASASVRRVEKPGLSVGPSPPMKPPNVSKHALWADFYEVCFDVADQPQEVFACVSMEPFIAEIQSKAPDRHLHAFVWPGDTGRMDQETLMLPDAAMCSDIIISAYARWEGWFTSTFHRHMYLRIPLARALHWDSKPRWYEMRPVSPEGGFRTAGFILMSINVGPEQAAPKRPRRERVQLNSYTFRAYVYQAVNLPVKDKEGTSDPFVSVFFGPAALHTEIVGGTLNPSWNQVLEATVEVPENEALRPDIHLFVRDMDDEGAQAMAMARCSTREAGSLPPTWQGPPRWLKLEPMPGGVPTQGRLLAAFELEPQAGRLDAEPKAAMPPTAACSVEFYVVGVRMRNVGPSLKNPRLQVIWGRKEEDRSEPKKAKFTGLGRGSDGQYNFLEQVSLTCKLSKDPLYQDWLEVRLLSDDEHDDTMAKTVSFATIQLVEFLPWVNEEQRKQARQDFRAKRLSVLNEAECALERARSERPATTEEETTPSAPWKRSAEAVEDQELLTCRSLGWDVDSIEASNARRLGAMEFTNLTEEDQAECKKVLEDCVARHGKSDGPEWGAALVDFIKNFEWPIDEGVIEDLDKHPDIDCELNVSSEIPYSRTDLFVGTDWGDAEVVGALKFCCRILERERLKRGGPEVEAADRAWEAKLRGIEEVFRQSQDLAIRAYILSADGLTPCSGSSDCSTYIWTRATTREDEQVHSFRDNLAVRRHTLHPRFHRCHALQQCRLPENGLLEVTVMEQVHSMFGGVASERAVGSTVIDLEDRWFSRRYRSMVEEDAVPIESRELHRPDSSFSKGHLRLWVDIMTSEQSQSRKLATLPSTEPAPFQLRIVIWKVTKVEAVDGQAPDIYVTGWHEMDDGTTLKQSTDTHYGADDGTGTFNWRFVFDLKAPCRDPRFAFRVWNDRLITDEPLAEVTLDLSRDFIHARRENASVELPRGTVHMTHPAFPGDISGILDMQGILLPLDEAMERPVGRGREEPNEDPFVDPEDPHLKAHRSYVGNLAIVQTIRAAGAGILMGAKLLTVLYMVGGAISGIVFVITTIVMLTK
uniref:C2 domain-containing protein n=1 Tax=Alexandrium monilatum TaxID=311494 RepID=A0A7S4T5M2_9DINO|mmetsp:Transcript_65634/g.203195  ORF Transcript_65634/g.203195 Transcript_65634/m.203195 type:complete len:1351 (-) Transcript_65634:99-4151(-)